MKSNKMNAKDSHVEQREAQTELTTPTGSEFYEMGCPTSEDVYFSETNMFRRTVRDYRGYDGSYSAENAYLTA